MSRRSAVSFSFSGPHWHLFILERSWPAEYHIHVQNISKLFDQWTSTKCMGNVHTSSLCALEVLPVPKWKWSHEVFVFEIRAYQSYVPISKLTNVFYTNPPWQRKTWVTPTCPSDLPSCWSCPVSFEVSWLIQSTRHGGETKKHPWGCSQNLAWWDWCGYKHEKIQVSNLLRNMELLPTMYPASLENKSSWVLPGRIFTRSWCGGVM